MNTHEMFQKFQDLKSSMSVQAKGDFAEKLVFNEIREFQKRSKGVLFENYKYPYARKESGDEYPGNLKLKDTGLISEERKSGEPSLYDEIDFLFLSKFSIIVVEAKAYGAKGGIVLRDEWWEYPGNKKVEEKYPIAQTEKHCRHLYHSLYDLLPNGEENYIVPICVFVDKQTISDLRSSTMKQKIIVCSLNQLYKELVYSNQPGNKALHYTLITKRLKDIKISGNLYELKGV